MPPRRPVVPIGSHVPVAGGLAKAIRYAADIGAEALQIFAGNPRGWALSYGNPDDDRAFRKHCERNGIPVYVHTPYLVNVGSPTATTYELSVGSIRHNLARAKAIGAKGVVVHTGSCVSDGSYDVALKQVREGVLPLLDSLDRSGDKAPFSCSNPPPGKGVRCVPASTTCPATSTRWTGIRRSASASTPATSSSPERSSTCGAA